jgi:hypothetical protein
MNVRLSTLVRIGVAATAALTVAAMAAPARANSPASGRTVTAAPESAVPAAQTAPPAAAQMRVARPTAILPATAGYFRIVNKASGKCLTPWGTGDGTAITQVACNGDNNQWWVLDTGSVGQIYNYATGKCLDLWGNGSSDAQLVFTWTCYGASSQRWRPVNTGGAYFELHPYYTDKCLDLANGSPSDGAVIQQWGCHLFNDNQQWWLG